MPAAKEVFGANSRANSTENDALEQFTYYETISHIQKGKSWWTRSYLDSEPREYILGYTDGTLSWEYNNRTKGIAPFGVI